MIEIRLDDREVRAALERLERRLGNLKPVMNELGELIVERAKRRFETSTGPDGKAWAKNAPSTIAAYLGRSSGNYKKRGGLTKRGQARAAAKKPLIGETKELSRQIAYRADKSSVTVYSSREQAAVMQFGAKRGAFGRTKRGAPIPWGDIPPRPFLPVTADGNLYPDEIDAIRDKLIELLDKDVE